jgi:ABC-type glycerol-3-phosphate transport system substrate-binding protein
MMMPRDGAHPKETWEFLKYYGGLENSINMLEILSRNSARKDFYDTPQWKAAVAEYPYLEMVPVICASGYTYPYKRFEEINDTFRPYFQKALLGTMPLEDAMREGNAAIERVLKGNWADELLRQAEAGGGKAP